jgi:tetratricopeptide (TPR) repeat protein
MTLILLTLLAYAPVLGNGYIWDDDFYVTQNPTLQSLSGLRDIWMTPTATPQYYPMVHSMFWVEYHLWGLNPLGFHVVNVLLHLGSALLLWQLLMRLGMPWRWAWGAAAIFALHPVQVESVAWITERKNVLSCLFYLLAAKVYLHFDARRQWRFWWIALCVFVLALLSKTVVLTLPAAMLVILWQQRGRLRFKTDILPTLPFFVIGIAMGITTAWLEKTHVGATGHEWNHDLLQRVLLAGRVVCFYVSKLVLPVNLSFVYPRWEISTAVWWQWLFPVGVLAVLLGSVVYGVRTGRRFVPACLLCFVGTLLPALGFFDVFPFRYSFVADHFQYHASIGMCVLLAVVLCRVCSRPKWIIPLVLIVCVGLTMKQSLNYANAQTLWRATIQTNPDAWLARNNLALILRQRGELDEVKRLMDEAIRRTPQAIEPRLNMGQLLMELGKPQEALEHYDVVLQLIPDDRRALLDKAIALEQLGRWEEARDCFTQTVEVYERFPRFQQTDQGWLDYTRALEGSGQDRNAISIYEQQVKDHPSVAAQVYQRLGLIAQRNGAIATAVLYFKKSAELGQSASVESINHWAWILATAPDDQLRDGNRALQLAIRICQITSNRAPRYLDTLAAASAEVGRFDQAITTEQQAIALAQQGGFTKLAQEMALRLKLYQAHQPYRDPTLH